MSTVFVIIMCATSDFNRVCKVLKKKDSCFCYSIVIVCVHYEPKHDAEHVHCEAIDQKPND